MSNIAVHVEGLSKQYRIGTRVSNRTLREALVSAARAPLRWFDGKSKQDENTFWALNDISFEIKHGEAIGIIGRNGAGKSTLLKILSRITKPTRGRVEIYGRVGSLLEVGTGFHSELSGRENIYLNGAVLGMKRREIDRKFDEIVDFAEVEKFLDTPAKHYSSGMYMRLAFAVAAHLEPEILVVDEVLAVGDIEFQKKCLGKMSEVVKGGRTVLFVSHNMAAIQSLCESAYLLSSGKLIFAGNTENVVNQYIQEIGVVAEEDLKHRMDRSGDQRLKFTKIALEDENGKSVQELVSGRDGYIVLDYEAREIFRKVVISIGIYSNFGQFLLMCNNEMAGHQFDELPLAGQVKCSLPKLPFSQGTYRLNLYCEVNGVLADWVQEAAILHVLDGDFYGTGKSAPTSHGGFLARQIWSASKEAKNGS